MSVEVSRSYGLYQMGEVQALSFVVGTWSGMVIPKRASYAVQREVEVADYFRVLK